MKWQPETVEDTRAMSLGLVVVLGCSRYLLGVLYPFTYHEFPVSSLV